MLYEREELGQVAENEEDEMERYYGKTPLALPPLPQTPFLLGPILFQFAVLFGARRSHGQNSSVTISMIATIEQDCELFILNICYYVHSKGKKVYSTYYNIDRNGCARCD